LSLASSTIRLLMFIVFSSSTNSVFQQY
jgi:hypothetical protein